MLIDGKHRIAFDTVLRRPACALLQPIYGGDADMAGRFHSESWLIAPTPDMHCFEATDDQVRQLIAMCGTSHTSRP